MRVLVTGATGFVGQHVIPILLERGHSVTTVARNEERARGFEWFSRVRFVHLDIHRQLDDPVVLFGEQDVVMHLAWPALPNYKAPYHLENTLPSDYRFIKSLVLGGFPNILVAGTCLEYGIQNGCLSEDMPTLPTISYAKAKDTLRKYLEMLQKEKPFTLQWARLFYMHGRGQSRLSLLAQLDTAIDNGDSIFNMSAGEQLRDYLPVEEVARRLVMLIQNPQCNGVTNICSGKPISIRRLVEQRVAERAVEIKLNLGYYQYLDYEPMASWGSESKFKRMVSNI
jgi:nucleoside-diphosphate-sugar epimerase